MLYILGLSYGAVEIVLNSLGIGIGKTSVFRAVQAIAAQVPGLKREKLLQGYQTQAVGADVTSVRCNGKWVTVGIVVDAVNGVILSIDELPGESAEQLQAWLEPILDAVDAEVVVSDDADAFKQVRDQTGRSQPGAQKTSHALKESIYAMPTLANQARVKNMILPIGCATCLWIAGTCGRA